MMKKLLTSFLIFGTTLLSAQSMSKNVMASAGNQIATSEVTLSYTIGEPIIGMIQGESAISQGFWAGSLQVEAISDENDLEGIKVYPNPVESELTIFTDNNEILGISLFAMNGSQVFKQNVENTPLEHRLDLHYLSKGVYILHLFMKDGGDEKIFKIIKQ